MKGEEFNEFLQLTENNLRQKWVKALLESPDLLEKSLTTESSNGRTSGFGPDNGSSTLPSVSE